MAINVIDNFNYKGSKPLDARIKYESVAAMAGAATADLYDGCLAYVTATKKYYSYDSSNTTDPTTGKWREYSSGGSGADTEIIADDFDAAESYAVGEYVVYEGALYKCATAHTGDWDASDFEDTQVMEEIPTPMPAADMSDIVTPLPSVMSRRFKYSTEEQVVGEWIDGKPVYQKTFSSNTTVTISSSGWTNYIAVSEPIEMIVQASGIHRSENNIFKNILGEVNVRYDSGYIQLNSMTKASTTSSSLITLQYTKTTD